MTLTEYLDAIAEKLGVNGLPDRLLTTYLKAFAQNQGVDVSALPDNLTTTYLSAIRNARGGQPVQDNLITTHLAEIAKTYGLEELPSNMISAYLEAIVAVADSGGGSGGGEPPELLSWEGVAYHIDKGTYKDVYKIGDMVPLDLGSEGLINMQIAAFDKDTLADGSGTAAISWVAKELLKTRKFWNPDLVDNGDGTYQEGTGTIGGWEKSDLRAYLNETIMPTISEDVTSLIQAVKKSHISFDVSGASYTQTTEDELWIPVWKEVSTSGIYKELFPNNASRVKYNYNGGTSARNWWGRGASKTSVVAGVGTSGSSNNLNIYNGANYMYYVCLGFCTGRTPT